MEAFEKYIGDTYELVDVIKSDEKNFVVGGGEIYKEILPYAESLGLGSRDYELIEIN